MVAPVISGTVPGQITGVDAPAAPFSKVTISDPDSGAPDAAIIAVSGGGTLADGAGFSGLALTSTPGLYTTACNAAANLTKEVDALVYTPAASPSHGVQNIGVNLVDVSTAGSRVSNTATTLTAGPGPATGKVSSTAPVGGAPVNLTSAILNAATPGIKSDTLTITADSTGGTLGSVSLVNGQLTYSTATTALSHIPANGSAADSFAYTITINMAILRQALSPYRFERDLLKHGRHPQRFANPMAPTPLFCLAPHRAQARSCFKIQRQTSFTPRRTSPPHS